MSMQRGFTYLGLLIAIALVGLGLAAASEVWTKTVERQRMAELEWVGQQYVDAIGSYYEATPGLASKAYPRTLSELLEDPRYVTTRRYLRQIYPNPFTGKVDWVLVTSADGGIRGVATEDSSIGSAARYEFSHTRAASAR